MGKGGGDIENDTHPTTSTIFQILTTQRPTTQTDIIKSSTSKNTDSGCLYGYTDGKCTECGVTYYGNRIVGGSEAVEHSWPSIVNLIFNYTFEYDGNRYDTSGMCGGTLVNRNTVITAAHCFQKFIQFPDGTTYNVFPNFYYPTIESMYSVYLGTHKLSNIQSSTLKKIKSFRVHPNFDSDNILNDIAVIKLESEVDLNDKIQFACIPNSANIFPNETNIDAFIVGWGKTKMSASSSPDALQQASITVYDKSKCSSVVVSNVKNWNNQICAGKFEGGVDSCQGDSGGPMFVEETVNGERRYVLAGLTSYGDGCGVKNKPG